jgi:DNA replication licensing factor MCM7
MEEEVYAHDRQYIKEFLETFRVEEFDPVYLKAIQSVLDCQSRSINVDLSDLQTFSEATEGCELYENVVSNCRRYATLFADEIDNVMKKLVSTRPFGDDDLDVVLQQRQLANTEGADTPLPALLQRRYDVFFNPQRVLCR